MIRSRVWLTFSNTWLSTVRKISEGKTIIEYLEKVGVNFGYNLNAATGWDNTTYQMTDVPTSRQGIIDSALLILHDWSHFIALHPEEIDSERGVIMEELRTRDGASWRSTMALIKALGKDSKYEHRNLIGYLDYLKSFDHQALRDFYHQWYRPDYQAVIIVGDIDVDTIEAKVKKLMSDIPAPAADASHKEMIVVPDNEKPIVSILSDPEMQGSRTQIFIKRPALPKEMNNTVQAETLDVIQAYISAMEDARLQEIAMQPDAPFLGAGMDCGDILGVIPTMNLTAFIAVTQDGKLPRGFEALCTEMEKVRRFGFTQGEFERAQTNLLRRAERKYTNRNDRTNNEFVRSYLSNFSKNTPIPSAETEWQIDSMLIVSVDLNSVNAVARQLITPNNQVITVTVPEKEGIETPTEEEILAIRDKVTAAELQPYEDTTVKEPLLPEGLKLKGSPVKKTVEDAAYGTTVWTLKNGVKVVVKPTTFKADEIRMNAIAEGGLSVLSDEEVPVAEFLPVIRSMSGAGKFSSTELRKQLAGITASVNIDVDNYFSTVNAACSPKDIETMLQLLYLNFAQPRFDEADYNTLMKMIRSQLENAKTNPDFVMEEHFIDAAYGHNPRRRMTTAEMTDEFRFEPCRHPRELFRGRQLHGRLQWISTEIWPCFQRPAEFVDPSVLFWGKELGKQPAMGSVNLNHVKSTVLAELCGLTVGIYDFKDQFTGHFQNFADRCHFSAGSISNGTAILIAADAGQSAILTAVRKLNVCIGAAVMNCTGSLCQALLYAESIQLKLLIMGFSRSRMDNALAITSVPPPAFAGT